MDYKLAQPHAKGQWTIFKNSLEIATLFILLIKNKIIKVAYFFLSYVLNLAIFTYFSPHQISSSFCQAWMYNT